MWADRRVVVTGATGFLGSHLTARLVGLGARVAVLVRDRVPLTSISSGWWPAVAVAGGAVEDGVVVGRLLAEYEAQTVFHLAAQSQVGVASRHPGPTWETNVRGTWSLLEAVRQQPTVEQVVVASSDKAYGAQPRLPYSEDMPLLAVNPYDVSKACADMIASSYATTFGTPVVISRCGNLFGPGDLNWRRLVPGTIRSVLRDERPVIRSDGTNTRDYLYVPDAVDGYLRMAEGLAGDPSLAGEAFNLSAEQPLTVLEVVSRLQHLAGTRLEPEIRADASHEIDSQCLSAEKARRVLGWRPAHTIDDALGETVAWYRDHLA